MTARIVLGLVLVALGAVLPVLAVQKKGPPWAFRDREAVVLETVGTIELASPDGQVKRLAPGDGIRRGEEVRVGAVSEVRMRTAGGAIVRLADGTRAQLERSALHLLSGWARFEIEPGAEEQPATSRVVVPLLDVELELGEGRHLLVFDGRTRLEALCEEGRARATAGQDQWAPGTTGKLLRAGRGEAPVWGPPAAALRCRARCQRLGANAVVEGQAEVGAQLFVNGRPSFPDADGSFRMSLPLGQGEDVVVFGRDASGNVCQAAARCGG